MTKQNELPDFKQLSDRMIIDPNPGPFIVAKTNLDPKTNEEENPYRSQHQNQAEDDKADEFFTS